MLSIEILKFCISTMASFSKVTETVSGYIVSEKIMKDIYLLNVTDVA